MTLLEWRSTTNMDCALGLDSVCSDSEELVMLENGEIFDLESKVLGFVSGRRAVMSLF
jgi:hypothetical protein